MTDKKQAKKIAKLDKLQRRIDNLIAWRDKCHWKQLVHANKPLKCQKLQQKEGISKSKLIKLKADMLKQCVKPQECFPVDQFVWYASKYGLYPLLQTFLTPDSIEVRFGPSETTPLMNAAMHGHLDCVQFLVHSNADVNAINKLGETALHCAASQHHDDIVRFLLSSPLVNPFIKNSSGETALVLARRCAITNGDKYARYAASVRALEAASTVIAGWLQESLRDSMLNRYVLGGIGLSSHSWRRRYVVVLRTSLVHEYEFVHYESTQYGTLPAVPICIMTWNARDNSSLKVPGTKYTLNNEEFTFSVLGKQIYPVSTESPCTFDFATKIEDEHKTWTHLLRTKMPMDDSNDELFPLPSQPALHALDHVNHDEFHPLPVDTFEELFPPSPVIQEVFPIATVKSVEVYEPSAATQVTTNLSMASSQEPRSENECIVCMDKSQEGVCVPCGHHAVCMDCAQAILTSSKACPVCRVEVREIIRISYWNIGMGFLCNLSLQSVVDWAWTFLQPDYELFRLVRAGDSNAIREFLCKHTSGVIKRAIRYRDDNGQTALMLTCVESQLGCLKLMLQEPLIHLELASQVDANGNGLLHLSCTSGAVEILRHLLQQGLSPYTLNNRFQSPLDIARTRYFEEEYAPTRYLSCIDLLEQHCTISEGWLYESIDNFASNLLGNCGLQSWKRRYCIVLRTALNSDVELVLFSFDGDKRDHSNWKRSPTPASIFLAHMNADISFNSKQKIFNKKEFAFSIPCIKKSVETPVTNLHGSYKLTEFACIDAVGYEMWGQFFATDLYQPLTQSVPIRSAKPFTPSAPSVESIHFEEVVRASAAPLSAPAYTPPMQQELEEKRSSNECVVCLDNPIEAVCVPCGHNAMCMACANQVHGSGQECPVCRTGIREVIKLYRA